LWWWQSNPRLNCKVKEDEMKKLIIILVLSMFLCGTLLDHAAMAAKKPFIVYTSLETE
jgi:hypothetical protein